MCLHRLGHLKTVTSHEMSWLYPSSRAQAILAHCLVIHHRQSHELPSLSSFRGERPWFMEQCCTVTPI